MMQLIIDQIGYFRLLTELIEINSIRNNEQDVI